MQSSGLAIACHLVANLRIYLTGRQQTNWEQCKPLTWCASTGRRNKSFVAHAAKLHMIEMIMDHESCQSILTEVVTV